MNCREAMLHIGAEPAALPGAVAEHVAGCAACGAVLRDALAFEQTLGRALSLPPPGLSPRPALPDNVAVLARPSDGSRAAARVAPPRYTAQRWALAASLVLAAALGIFLWTGRPADTLAADVVAHMAGEPGSWSQTAPAPQAEIERVLAQAGARLDPGTADVVYVHSCWFRGHWTPHLVVRTSRGPVTVLVLRSESVTGARHFTGDGYYGMLVPFGAGSLAVLGQTGEAVTGDVLQRLTSSLHWVS